MDVVRMGIVGSGYMGRTYAQCVSKHNEGVELVAVSKGREIFGDRIAYTSCAAAAVAEAELVFIITEWDEFRDPGLYQGKKVFEGRRVLKDGPTNNVNCEGICW